MRNALMTISATALIASCTHPARAPERDFLQGQIDKTFDEPREKGRDALCAPLLYPKEVRHAILEISQYPELVVRFLRSDILRTR